MTTLATLLDSLTVEGELYEKLEDGSLRCFACGHRCLIREGKRGICQVRFNQGGELRVPWGYVGALQSDPIEKKPFSHVMPGTNALTFGMLGCDYHCGYCFTGDTVVVTDRGPMSFQEAFDLGESYQQEKDAVISFPKDLMAISSSGNLRKIKGVFKHPYQGHLIQIKPYYLPAIRCTPDHRVYATQDPAMEPSLVHAKDLTREHFLAVPRNYEFSLPQVIDVERLVGTYPVTYQTPWKMSQDEMQMVMNLSQKGKTSHEIGVLLKKNSSYIRHLRSKIKKGIVTTSKTSPAYMENGYLRFPNERQPGIPSKIVLDTDLSELMGYYCAEGSIISSKDRPNSFNINFSFSKKETEVANRVVDLLNICFGVKAALVQRSTTLSVSVSKASLALLIKALAGAGSAKKYIPEMLFNASQEVVTAFLNAYVQGDGHRSPNGKTNITTVSRNLAYGVAWLVLKSGYLPSLYDAKMTATSTILGRLVNRAPHQYSVVWYENSVVKRKLVQTKDFHLIPIQKLESEIFHGDVFNMEVEEEHNYLAGFLLVSNCQNWLTSQAMRDPDSDVAKQLVREVTPKQLVGYAQTTQASVMVSSYNEPLITSEWAVAIFKEARKNGLMCAYVSNGNNTPEVMEFIAPYLDAYKVDLKCMSDKNYRSLGGVLQHTLDGIKRARDAGLWVEVVTLVIPGFNDSNEELWDAARFLAGLSLDIPWHVTAFHKDYKMTDPDNTDARTLLRVAEIGREAGLHYVYAGNLPDNVGEYEDTHCPSCNHSLVKRSGYVIKKYEITGNGKCPKCGEKIPGLWPRDPAKVKLNGIGHPLPVW